MIGILLDQTNPSGHQQDSVIDWKGVSTKGLNLCLCHDEIRGQSIVILQVVFRFLESLFGDTINVIFVIFLKNLLQKLPNRSGSQFRVRNMPDDRLNFSEFTDPKFIKVKVVFAKFV